MTTITSLDAVKIQSRAVIPIAKALEARIGKEAAHQLIGDAIAESWAQFVLSQRGQSAHPRDPGFDYPVDRVIVSDRDDEYRVNMTRCGFAQYFRGIGEPEIGALLTCGVDYAVTRLTQPDWEFSRTQTLMKGADHCDFCWTRKSPKGGSAGGA